MSDGVTARRREFSRLKIALVSDALTRTALANECRVRSVTPANHWAVLNLWRPDVLLVEATWRGKADRWRYKVADYPDHPDRTNEDLGRVVRKARDLGIPAIFWNREDGIHFDRFIDTARFFDRVLTVDETMIPAYREALGAQARVGVMMFATSTALHYPTDAQPQRRAAFVGSYGKHVHEARRAWQDMMFEATRDLGLTIYDRNSDRKPLYYRYPERPWIDVRDAIAHDRTPDVYRTHIVNLNVNTMTRSRTAFSRRLVEILGCGGLVVTNASAAIDAHFKGFCHVTDNMEEAQSLFSRIATEGLTRQEMEMRAAAARHVAREHSWSRRIPILLDMAA